jgi:tRNA threonylcarbamoyladenosine biosynthesis protein TsaB
MSVIAEALEKAGIGYPDLTRVGVSIGPGSFTGIRVGVSAARGLALALKIPAVGVTTLAALAAETRELLGPRAVMAALDAGRGEIHAAVYDEFANMVYDPSVITLGEAAVLAKKVGPALTGTAAASIASEAGSPFDIGATTATADIGVYARLAAKAAPDAPRPAPLYLRAPDAKPQAGFVLPRRAL